MIILDTDQLSFLDQDTIEGFTLGRRLAGRASGEVAVSIVTYEEQMRGWLTYVSRAATQDQQVDAYNKLHRHVDKFRRIPFVDYDAAAAAWT